MKFLLKHYALLNLKDQNFTCGLCQAWKYTKLAHVKPSYEVRTFLKIKDKD